MKKRKLLVGLSHKEIVGSVIRFMEKSGYSRYMFHKVDLCTEEYSPHPDCIFYKNGEEFVDVVEVKPEYATKSAVTGGIGQCISYLVFGYRPYIVTTKNYLNYILSVSQLVPQLGVIYVDEEECFIVNHPLIDKSANTDRVLKIIQASKPELPLRDLWVGRYRPGKRLTRAQQMEKLLTTHVITGSDVVLYD